VHSLLLDFSSSLRALVRCAWGGGVTGEVTQAGKGRGVGKGRGGQGGRGSGKVTKKRGPHLNICLGAPESLVTPLPESLAT